MGTPETKDSLGIVHVHFNTVRTLRNDLSKY